MIILIMGASHTGKTALAQRLLETYKYPCLSIDHLKMGLIRSGNTRLTPISGDEALTGYLWPIVSEMIKTAVENEQNLIVEGCYVPADWQKDFEDEYLKHIKYCCLIMSEAYIRNHFDDIKTYASAVENRGDDEDCTMERVLADNARALERCRHCQTEYVLIDKEYPTEIPLFMYRLNSESRGDSMIRHVILWKLKEELTEEERAVVKADIKKGLEGLAGRIPGLLEIRVYTQGLESSNVDLMLDSCFEDVQALQNYSVHPEHVAVADGKVRPYTAVRNCMDFRVENG